MLYGICNLSIIPMRIEPNDATEMTSQVLFGEHFKVLEKRKKWSKIRLAFDNYEGWIDNKQYVLISEEWYKKIDYSTAVLAGEIINFITTKNDNFASIPMGASLPLFKGKKAFIENIEYSYEGSTFQGKLSKEKMVTIACKYLNTPYLWGGRTLFGIDCSGFTQLIYKIGGCSLLRDAEQQAKQGDALSFIEESEPGDLAFFDNKEGKIIHVGIIMKDNYIIHAHGKVRIDRLDHTGIFNVDSKKYTHQLRVIKKVI